VHPAPEVLTLLGALLHGDWAVAEDSAPGIRRDVSGLVAAHLQWHLERQLRSLPLVERRAREATIVGRLGSDPVSGDTEVAGAAQGTRSRENTHGAAGA
jgi:DNA repair protein RecO (recombination protein O)